MRCLLTVIAVIFQDLPKLVSLASSGLELPDLSTMVLSDCPVVLLETSYFAAKLKKIMFMITHELRRPMPNFL